MGKHLMKAFHHFPHFLPVFFFPISSLKRKIKGQDAKGDRLFLISENDKLFEIYKNQIKTKQKLSTTYL